MSLYLMKGIIIISAILLFTGSIWSIDRITGKAGKQRASNGYTYYTCTIKNPSAYAITVKTITVIEEYPTQNGYRTNYRTANCRGRACSMKGYQRQTFWGPQPSNLLRVRARTCYIETTL